MGELPLPPGSHRPRERKELGPRGRCGSSQQDSLSCVTSMLLLTWQPRGLEPSRLQARSPPLPQTCSEQQEMSLPGPGVGCLRVRGSYSGKKGAQSPRWQSWSGLSPERARV